MPRPAARVLVACAAILAAGLAAWLAAARQPGGERLAPSPFAAAGYPPPGGPTGAPVTPTPAPTPTPDSSEGFFPPPDGIDHRLEPIGSSPHRALLAPLQAAIDAGDAATPSQWVSERFGNRLFDIAHLDGEGGVALDRAGTRDVLGAFLDQGSRPRVQGYFATQEGEVVCLDVFTALYQGTVPHPPSGDELGPRPPELVPADAAAFHVCRDQAGAWIWSGWAYGGYHELVAAYAALHGGGADYVVTRP